MILIDDYQPNPGDGGGGGGCSGGGGGTGIASADRGRIGDFLAFGARRAGFFLATRLADFTFALDFAFAFGFTFFFLAISNPS